MDIAGLTKLYVFLFKLVKVLLTNAFILFRSCQSILNLVMVSRFSSFVIQVTFILTFRTFQALGFLSNGYATGEFEVTKERLGVYSCCEHIDNPKVKNYFLSHSIPRSFFYSP